MVDRKKIKDVMFENHPFGKGAVADQVETIAEYRNERVLIAGCGAGSRVFSLHFYGADVTAVDQSEAAIEFIRSGFDEIGCDPPDLVAGDLLTVEFPSSAFDRILCFGVLHNTADPERILDRFGDWIAGDGTLELSLYHRRSFVRIERELVEMLQDRFDLGRFVSPETKRDIEWWDKYENPLWETYTTREARALVTDAGFGIESLRLARSPFGLLTRRVLPPVLRHRLESLFDSYRWHIRIEAAPH